MRNNRRSWVSFAVFAVCCAVNAAVDKTVELEFVGNPTLERWPTRGSANSILDIEVNDDRLFFACGEWASNPGPVFMKSYDPYSGAFTNEYAAGTEGVEVLRTFSDGGLYFPAIDHMDKGSYDNGYWFKRAKGGEWSAGFADGTDKKLYTHVYDMQQFGEWMFLYSGCPVGSKDGGANWLRLDGLDSNKQNGSLLRCGDEFFCVEAYPIDFGTGTNPNATPISDPYTRHGPTVWRWDAATEKFTSTVHPTWNDLAPEIILSDCNLVTTIESQSGRPGRFWHTTPFKDRCLYVIGDEYSDRSYVVNGKSVTLKPVGTRPEIAVSAYAENGALKGTRIHLPAKTWPIDFTVVGDAAYMLAFSYVEETQMVRHGIWKSMDGVNFAEILTVDYPQVMQSFDYHMGYFYFGVAHQNAEPNLGPIKSGTKESAGDIYRVYCPQEPVTAVASVSMLPVSEGGSSVINYTLSAQPAADVTLAVQLLGGAGLTLSSESVVFTRANWNSPHPVTVTYPQNDRRDAESVVLVCGIETPTSLRGRFDSPEVTASIVSVELTDDDRAPTISAEAFDNAKIPFTYTATLADLGSLNGQAAGSATVTLTAYDDDACTHAVDSDSKTVTATGEFSLTLTNLIRGAWYTFVAEARSSEESAVRSSMRLRAPIGTAAQLVDLTDDLGNRAGTYATNAAIGPSGNSGAWDNDLTKYFGGYKDPREAIYEFNTPMVVNGFGLRGMGNPASDEQDRHPSGYSLYGTADTNDTWTLLAQVTGDPIWNPSGEWRRIYAPNTTAYRYYKLTLDSAQMPNMSRIAAAEVELYFIGEPETPPEEPEEPVGLNNLGAPERDRFDLPLQQTWPAADYGAEVCLWRYDRYAALSFGHDDNCDWDIPFLLRESERNGFKLTWWLITKNIGDSGSTSGSGNWPEWRECFAAGHAIESHSHTHEWAGGGQTVQAAAAAAGMSVEDYVEFCMYSNSLAVIREKIPGCKPSTLAFPGGESYPEIANRYFVSGRSVGPYINRANAINYQSVNASSSGINPGTVNVLLGGRGGSKALTGWMAESFNDAKNYRGWFVPFLHTESTHDGLPNAGHEQGVAEQIQRFELLGRHRRHLWLGTYPAIAKYGQSRDTATLTVVKKTASEITFTLVDQMRDDWYDEPLTVKVRLPAAWSLSGVAATQGGNALDAFYIEREGARYALVNAIPDRGTVTLVPAAANSGAWDETSYEAPTYTYQVRFYDTDGTTLLKTIIAHPIKTSAAELAPVIYNPGYRLSWQTADDVSIDDITDDVDFTAVWTATDEKPKAVFVDDSTGEQLSAVDTVYGSRPAQPTDLPTREGYIAYWVPELCPLVSNTTYKVKWMTDDDPIPGAIIVRTAEEFCDAMANHPNETIRMVRDIDISGYGYTAVPEFSGTFKAYGHILTGLGAESLCVTNSGAFVGLKVLGDSDAEHPVLASGYGVFAVVSAEGVFADCRVDGYAIRANAQNLAYGVFVGTALKGTAFTNCTVGATCSIDQGSKPNVEIGGFVGELKVTNPSGTLITFVNCTNEAPILATGDYNTAHGDGGFIGRATGCGAEVNPEIVFVNCAGTGLVSSSGGNSNLGGYIGNVPGLTAKSTCKVIIEGGTTTMPVGEKAKNIGEWIGLGANVIVEHKEYIPPEPPEEPPEEPASAPRPVARWDVVPYQRFDGVFKAGVVAFHEDGVKVTFTYAGRTYVAENPAYNDRVKVWEYFVPIDASTLPDGDVVISATATSLGVTPVSFELPQLTLYANHGGTVGSTNSITVCPTNSLKDAITSVGDGGTVYLKAGTYSLNGFGDKTGRKYWTTLRPAEGVMRGEVKFSSGRPGMDKFRLKDLLLYTDSDGYSAIIMGENGGTVCWLDNCKFTCVGGRYRGNSNLFGNKMGGFVTGGVTEGMNNGPGGSLIRDHYVHSIAADTWTGSERLVVNCHVDDVDPGSSGAHPDFFQSHAVEPEWCHDVILYNVSGWSCKSQGLFGWRLKDAAFVNIVFHLEGGSFTSQFSGDLDNVLFAHLTLVDQTWNWREGFFPKNVRSVNGVYGNMIVYGHDSMKTDGSTGLTVDHNAFYGNKSKTSVAESDWGSNDVAIGRDFADEAAHDYSLVDGSAGLVNGIHLQCVPVDLNGNLYPSGARPCGAYTTPALATAIAKVWNDDWDKSGAWHDGDSEIETNGWFCVEFEDAGYKAGSDWTKTSTDKSGGAWSGDDGEATTLDATTRVVTLSEDFKGELRYTPSAASETNQDLIVEGVMQVSAAPRELRPSEVPVALTFESGAAEKLIPVVYVGGAWHPFGTTGFNAGSWVDWKFELDHAGVNAPRLRVSVAEKGGVVEKSGWIAGGFEAKKLRSVSYIGAGSFGGFEAHYLTVKGGEVIELVPPEFAADGSALGFETKEGGARKFALKIANPVKGAYYTVLTSTTLEGPFLPEGDSVLFDQDSGTLTLEVSADAPKKFAKILVSVGPIN